MARATMPAMPGFSAAGNLRPANTAFDGKYPIPTLAEVLDLARHSRTCSGAPYDSEAAGDPRTYGSMATAAGLAEIAQYADAVGFCKNVMIPRTSQGYLRRPTTAISDAHAVGLAAHGDLQGSRPSRPRGTSGSRPELEGTAVRRWLEWGWTVRGPN